MSSISNRRSGAIAGIAILLLALMIAHGCKKDSSSTTQSSAQSSGTSGKQIKLAGIVLQEDQFFRLVLFGMRDAAKNAGVELLEGNSENKPEKEIELINTYVTRNVDAILISPVSKQGSVAGLKLASDKGIKVITFNSPLGVDLAAAHIECSATDLGEQTGKAARAYIEKNLGGKAKVAIVAFKSQVPEQSDARTGGFKSQITQLPGVEIVAEQDAWMPEMAVKKVGDILTAHPDVNIVYGANEGGTTGSVLAVKNAGLAGKVAVFGTDCSEQLLSMLQSPDNILQAVTSQRPVEVGRLAVENAIKAINGQPVDKVTSLPGTLLTRTDPDGVKAFEAQFKQWESEASQ
jgi:ABC-type sugar transport system substrate-binding protein